ncbi:Plasmodium vivax Vir protein, putative [Plasmodium ovale]|uniref:Plasmodium vivax Vir protein, putative n=1 Tax=Plasmodium ovale TaxID=36330 RepID=A0A1C3KJ56_PLAOA|nr:Plasmodium vivax Vir protein, putative [Plasmodium ovale]
MGSEDYNTLNLTSNRCDYELDNTYVNAGKDEVCEKLGENSGEYTNAAFLCMGLNGNLKNYDKLNIFQKMNKYKCNYLNLWAYDRLSKLKGVEKVTMMSTLLSIWIKSEQYKKEECYPSQFATYSNSDDHITEKKLYDYALNYEDLENRYRKTDIIPCTTKIAEYINKSKELYRQVKSECETDKDHYSKLSCTALKNIETIYPKDELLNLECKRTEDESVRSREVEGSGALLQQVRQHDGHLKDHRRDRLGVDFREYASEDASSSDSHKAIGTTLPILGVLSIGFVLYKFTGLGSMARNFLRTKGINGINSQVELTHELLENTYDDNAHPDIDETYIGYQAI